MSGILNYQLPQADTAGAFKSLQEAGQDRYSKGMGTINEVLGEQAERTQLQKAKEVEQQRLAEQLQLQQQQQEYTVNRDNQTDAGNRLAVKLATLPIEERGEYLRQHKANNTDTTIGNSALGNITALLTPQQEKFSPRTLYRLDANGNVASEMEVHTREEADAAMQRGFGLENPADRSSDKNAQQQKLNEANTKAYQKYREEIEGWSQGPFSNRKQTALETLGILQSMGLPHDIVDAGLSRMRVNSYTNSLNLDDLNKYFPNVTDESGNVIKLGDAIQLSRDEGSQLIYDMNTGTIGFRTPKNTSLVGGEAGSETNPPDKKLGEVRIEGGGLLRGNNIYGGEWNDPVPPTETNTPGMARLQQLRK